MLLVRQPVPSSAIKEEHLRRPQGRSAIELQGLGKTFKLFPSKSAWVKEIFHPRRKKYHSPLDALANVSLIIEKGDVVGLIGRNGSGKSTLLQLIAGITRPSSGWVKVAGRVVALLDLGTGFNPELSGRENVYLCGAVLGLSRMELDERYQDIVTFSGVGKFIDQPLKTYSSGMNVRLAFALAMGVRPDILIVDEALAVGDTLFQAKCFGRLREFQQKGVTIILATHSLDLVTRLCNKACLLEKGRLIAFDDPGRVVDRYQRLMLGFLGNRTGPSALDAGYPGSIQNGMNGSREVLCAPGRHESRYGNGKVYIEHIGIYDKDRVQVNVLDQNGEYVFFCRILFIEQVVSPVFSYRIKDGRGNDVAGTNTLYHNIGTEIYLPQQRILLSFRQKISLSPGEYFLSGGCAGFEDGKYVVYDRRTDAVPFRVKSQQPCDGLVACDTKIIVQREQRVISQKYK